ncbi:uncharacterized protein JCM15063_002209 [Sporobolomyces koalae]|uniref:uncharacterized protein n=1 Tax=Sporobolomyces koalae TaxID=500713 RepID=UPI0031720404
MSHDSEDSPASSVSSIRARWEQLASGSSAPPPVASANPGTTAPVQLPTLKPATVVTTTKKTPVLPVGAKEIRIEPPTNDVLNAVHMSRGRDQDDASRSTNGSQQSWHSAQGGSTADDEDEGDRASEEAEQAVPPTPKATRPAPPARPPKPPTLNRSATLSRAHTATTGITSTAEPPTLPVNLVRSTTATYRKAPPPPVSGTQSSFSSVETTLVPTSVPRATIPTNFATLQPQTNEESRPASSASSVKSMASRFDATETGYRGRDDKLDPFGGPGTDRSDEISEVDGDEVRAQQDDNDEEDFASDSTYTSSDEDEEAYLSKSALARPVVPPRPILPVRSETEPVPRAAPVPPPPLPARSGTGSSTSSSSSTLAAPEGTAASVLTRSPANSISNGSSVPPGPVLPPRAGTVPPVANRAPPVLPARSLRPPSPETLRAPATPMSSAYVPPPPPTRTVHATDKVAPKVPTLARDLSSGDEDEIDEAAAKAQEFPDATFANRRPPTLRQRRTIQSNNHFYSFAIRGHQVVTAHHRIHLWRPATSALADEIAIEGDKHKFLSLEFRAAGLHNPEEDGRYVWAGTKEGHVYEFDTAERVITQVRTNLHSHPVSHIFRIGRAMLTLDDSGKCHFFPQAEDGRAALLGGPSRQQRVPDKQTFAAVVGDELWTSSGPVTKPGSTAVSMRSPQIRAFDPTGARSFSLLPRPLVTPESAGPIGAVTASAVVPSQPNLVFLGHDNGFVSVWDRANNYSCILVQRLSPYSISALVGVKRYLWAGFRTGYVYVYDVDKDPWTVLKAWKAHKDPVVSLVIDPSALWTEEILQVASATADEVSLWDGFLRDDWLDHELHLRQPDFCTFRSIRALCVSWNIDASRPHDLVGTMDNLEFLKNALHSTESPDIISFGFQEMIDLEDKKLTAKSMLLSKKKTTDKLSSGVSSAYRQWHDKLVQAVRLAMPPEEPYTVVHVGDMVGLFSCIFVKAREADRLRDVSLITVKTGMGGRYGNKGAILSRFVIDDTSLCFINVHLAAGHSHSRQRNRDLVDILEDKAAFSELGSSSFGAYSPGASGTNVFDHELTILSGDLNYRIDARRDFVISAIASGQSTSLLAHDQLMKNLATNQTFRLRSFREPPIEFPPTYKYDPGTDNYDSSVKRRIPAWCDRILYRADRSDKVQALHYKRYEVNVSDHRPISAAFDLQIKSIVPEKRSLVWNEIENSWKGVERQVLEEAKVYYQGF